MKIYSRFVRNYNPAQQNGQQMLKVAVGPGGDGPRWTDWTEAIMRAYQQHTWSWDINGLSLHNYTVVKWPPSYKSMGFGEDEYIQILKSTLEMDGLIKQQSAIMDKYDPEKKVGLYVDEWGVWADPNPGSNPGFLQQQNTLRDAVIAALNLNLFMRNADRIRGANIAQMINVLQAMILTDGPRLVLTPTYHVYHMYVPFHGATEIPVSFTPGTYRHGDIELPQVDAVAARDSACGIWLSLVNIDPAQAARFNVSVYGLRATTAVGQVLTGSTVDAHNKVGAPDEVAPKPYSGHVSGGQISFDLPAKAVAVVKLQ